MSELTSNIGNVGQPPNWASLVQQENGNDGGGELIDPECKLLNEQNGNESQEHIEKSEINGTDSNDSESLESPVASPESTGAPGSITTNNVAESNTVSTPGNESEMNNVCENRDDQVLPADGSKQQKELEQFSTDTVKKRDVVDDAADQEKIVKELHDANEKNDLTDQKLENTNTESSQSNSEGESGATAVIANNQTIFQSHNDAADCTGNPSTENQEERHDLIGSHGHPDDVDMDNSAQKSRDEDMADVSQLRLVPLDEPRRTNQLSDVTSEQERMNVDGAENQSTGFGQIDGIADISKQQQVFTDEIENADSMNVSNDAETVSDHVGNGTDSAVASDNQTLHSGQVEELQEYVDENSSASSTTSYYSTNPQESFEANSPNMAQISNTENQDTFPEGHDENQIDDSFATENQENIADASMEFDENAINQESAENQENNSENQGENQNNEPRYIDRNIGLQEEDDVPVSAQNQSVENQQRVPFRVIGGDATEYQDEDEDVDDEESSEQIARGQRRFDIKFPALRDSSPTVKPKSAFSRPSRRPEDDIPGTSGTYNYNRRPEDDIPGTSGSHNYYRRPEDDIPGPSNKKPLRFRRLLDDDDDDGPGPSTSRRPNDNIPGPSYSRRRPEDDIPGPSNSHMRYDDDIPESDCFQDDPIEGEELERLLRIANVTRFEAGLDTSRSSSSQYGPSHNVVYGPLPKNFVVNKRRMNRSTSPGPSSVDPAHIDKDYEYAKKLQAEEDRRVRFEDNQSYTYSEAGPSSRNTDHDEYDPWIPSDYQDNGNEGDSEGDNEEEKDSSKGSGVYEINLGPRMSTDEAGLYKECARLYRICRSSHPENFVPKPNSIEGMHPSQFIRGYRRVISGKPFDDLDQAEGPPVPPGSPGPPEGSARTTTVTTAYRVVKSDGGESLRETMFLKIPSSVVAPVAKKEMKMGAGKARRQAFQASQITDLQNGPTAFQKFVKSTDAAFRRVQCKPLFSDPDDDQPGTSGPVSSEEWAEELAQQQQRKRRLNAKVDIESGEPGPFRRMAPVREVNEEGMNDDMGDADDEPIRRDADEGVFAVPVAPLKIGRIPSLDGFSSGEPFSYETSPAGQRKIYEQRRKRPEKPRLSLQMPLNDYGEGPSTSGPSTSGPSTSGTSNRRAGGSSIFAPDLVNRHSFLRRTDDEDSVFNNNEMDELQIEVEDNAVVTEAAETNWPGIAWKDPENMPSLEQIPENEIKKMPAEYVDEIIMYQCRDKSADRVRMDRDEVQKELEERFLQVCRSYVESPSRVPPELMNTRFEIFIRFPFLRRPIYVQNVLVVFEIKDNEGDVLAKLPEKYQGLSIAEFYKQALKSWYGLRLTDSLTNMAIPTEQLEDSIVTYHHEVSQRWFHEIQDLPEEDREEAEMRINDQMEEIVAIPISNSDMAEIDRYRLQFLEEKRLSALQTYSMHRQRMKVVGNSLSGHLPQHPAINRVRLADAVEIEDIGEEQEEVESKPAVRKEDGELDSDDDEELTETQL